MWAVENEFTLFVYHAEPTFILLLLPPLGTCPPEIAAANTVRVKQVDLKLSFFRAARTTGPWPYLRVVALMCILEHGASIIQVTSYILWTPRYPPKDSPGLEVLDG